MLFELNHALAAHKLTLLRDQKTPSHIFRRLLAELGVLLAYETTKNLPLVSKKIMTPLAPVVGHKLQNQITIVPIIRAGIGLLEAFLEILPNAAVGFIGMERNETTARAHSYYYKIKKQIEDDIVIIIDPMLATGDSAVKSITEIKKSGPQKIIFAAIIAAPEGIACLQKAHPDVDIYLVKIDQKLNDKCYILPGLGDAGDRYYGTD